MTEQTDNSVSILQQDIVDTDSQVEPASAGLQLLIYSVIGVFFVMGLFTLCMAADAMGRSFSTFGKRLFFADGSGHTSLLTECVVFVFVLILVAILISQAYQAQKSIFIEDEDYEWEIQNICVYYNYSKNKPITIFVMK